jgi:hypothetical protein
MRRAAVTLLTLALVLSGRLALPSEASAQYRPLSDTINVGVSIGTGAGAPLDGGFELGATLEVPLSLSLRARVDAAAGRWQYDGDPLAAAPPATFGRHRFVGSLIRPILPLRPGRRLGSYWGAGGGLYFLRFAEQPDAISRGAHWLYGLEYLSSDHRWLFTGEVQIMFVQDPYQLPSRYQRENGLGVHAGIAVKRRLS